MNSRPIESLPAAKSVVPTAELANETPLLAEPVLTRSWVFRSFDFIVLAFARIFGLVSIVVCTAIVANIPILQLLSFGYLIEVCGRISRGEKVSAAMVGITKAAKIGGIFFGTWILLIPIRFFSDHVWYEAFLIDPSSNQTAFLRVLQFVLIGLTLLQILAAWIAGGKLRYFFWQLFAPFSIAVWCFRKLIGISLVRSVTSFCLDWFSPNLTNDLCNVQPPSDWFLPAILWKRIRSGKTYSFLRDGLWDFIAGLKLPYYFKLGFLGFAGTIAWLFVPTALLIGATELKPPAAVISSILGFATAIPVFAALPAIQAHFSKKRTLRSFFELRSAFRIAAAAPLAYVFSLLLILVFALPLFIAKVEPIPQELVWLLSILFVLFAWPSRIFIGLAYRRGVKQISASRAPRWWIRFPILMCALPISAAFTVIFFFTQYVAWHGAVSLFENHVYLLPAPYWL